MHTLYLLGGAGVFVVALNAFDAAWWVFAVVGFVWGFGMSLIANWEDYR